MCIDPCNVTKGRCEINQLFSCKISRSCLLKTRRNVFAQHLHGSACASESCITNYSSATGSSHYQATKDVSTLTQGIVSQHRILQLCRFSSIVNWEWLQVAMHVLTQLPSAHILSDHGPCCSSTEAAVQDTSGILFYFVDFPLRNLFGFTLDGPANSRSVLTSV